MKRYYVCPKSVWDGLHSSGEPFHTLMAGSSYVELDSTNILLITDFSSEWAENEWHSQPEVARLTHPQLEATVPLAQLHSNPQYAHKQFTLQHFQLLQNAFGLDNTHTVWGLHSKLMVLYPGMKLSIGY